MGALAVVLACGCAHPRKTPVAVDAATLDDMGFQAYLADAPVVTVDEACRAILILADGHDKTRSWEARQALLVQRGLIRQTWALQPENIADRGTIAYMICRICRIKGGVNHLLLGTVGLGDRRYAYRELVYRGMMDSGTEWGFLTGGQMVALLSKADQYMETQGLYGTDTFEIGQEPAATP